MNRKKNRVAIKERIKKYLIEGDLGGVKPSTMERYIRDMKRKNPDWYQQIVKTSFKDNSSKKEHLDPEVERLKKKGYYVKDEDWNFKKDSGTTEVLTTTRFTSLEQIAEYCEIDRDVWEAERMRTQQWINSPEFDCWLFRVDWKRIKGVSPEVALRAYEKKLEGYPTNEIPLVQAPKEPSDLMLEINIPDLHLGRHAWGKETGASYDVKIAVQEWMRAHQYFFNIYKDLSTEEVVIPIGSDFFNVDSMANTTTNGTPQQEDGRFQRSFEYGLEACVQAIDIWRKKSKVKVVIIRGNHDFQRATYLGSNLKSWYRNDDDVEIDNSPAFRKYIVYGVNLLGLTHGQKDYKRLPTVFQSEMRHVLSQVKFVEWHVAHTHSEKTVESFGGCVVRTVSSLAQRSSWETEMGYGGIRQSQAFRWSKTKGLLGSDYFTPMED